MKRIMKSCPKCDSIDVPDNTERCPFCGYSFVIKEKKIVCRGDGYRSE